MEFKSFTIGQYKYEPTGKLKNIPKKVILNSAWPSGTKMPTEEDLKQGLVFILVVEGGDGLSRTAFVRENLYMPYIVKNVRKDTKWVVSERHDINGKLLGVLTNTETDRDFYYASKDLAESKLADLEEWTCEELKKTRLTDES